ncbi:hypothetical protein EVAR_18949_1 [Eumeta japonica]|uniref:Uncharacterized protein n=1 Tax=Eumeta variegata TaxID=151549 RepID=A0A4C1V416_EUMVA|nr:hypothetical protein EVAR_18949_1 [Eumeta japonica]
MILASMQYDCEMAINLTTFASSLNTPVKVNLSQSEVDQAGGRSRWAPSTVFGNVRYRPGRDSAPPAPAQRKCCVKTLKKLSACEILFLHVFQIRLDFCPWNFRKEYDNFADKVVTVDRVCDLSARGHFRCGPGAAGVTEYRNRVGNGNLLRTRSQSRSVIEYPAGGRRYYCLEDRFVIDTAHYNLCIRWLHPTVLHWLHLNLNCLKCRGRYILRFSQALRPLSRLGNVCDIPSESTKVCEMYAISMDQAFHPSGSRVWGTPLCRNIAVDQGWPLTHGHDLDNYPI